MKFTIVALTSILLTALPTVAHEVEKGPNGGRVIEAGHDNVDLEAAISALHELGYASILTEGGPRLLGYLDEAGLIDELCLTTSPVLAAGSAERITMSPSAPAAPLSLVHVLHDDGFLFSRYQRRQE